MDTYDLLAGNHEARSALVSALEAMELVLPQVWAEVGRRELEQAIHKTSEVLRNMGVEREQAFRERMDAVELQKRCRLRVPG